MNTTFILSFLILVATYTIWRIIRHILFTYRCIDEEVLHEFEEGTLRRENPRMYRKVIAHVNHCEKCQEQLEEIRNGKPIEDHLIE